MGMYISESASKLHWNDYHGNSTTVAPVQALVVIISVFM